MHVTNPLQKSFLLLAVVLFSFCSLSQDVTPQQTKKDKIEQLKIAYITKELDLSTEEAEKFWPAYNEMNDALKAEKKSRQTKSRELKNKLSTLSEKEIEEKTLAILDSEIVEAELKKEYTKKIANVIGYKKIIQLFLVEKQFKKELLNRLNEGQGQNRRPRQGQNRPNRSRVN